MALHGFLRCLKYVVFSVNFIVWIAGMGVLGLAIYLRTDPEMNGYVKAAYQEKKLAYDLICYVLVGGGVIVTFIGFLGCCGAFHESKPMLGSFFASMLLILVIEVTVGVLAFIYKNKVNNSVTDNFSEYVRNSYGKDVHYDEPIDLVQRNLQCCGGENPTDWNHSLWMTIDPHHTHKVPESCCRGTKLPKVVMLNSGVCGVAGDWRNNTHPGVHSQGCGDKLMVYFEEKVWLFMLTFIGLAVIQVLSLIVSLTLCSGMCQQRYGGYKS